MSVHTPDQAEQEFFKALLDSNTDTLNALLADDFVLVDVMTGSEVSKMALLEVLRQGQLKFEKIDRLEFRVRTYERTAVIVGRTQMAGQYAGQSFGASSRYTHVFVNQNGEWHMVSAQGTPIAPAG